MAHTILIAEDDPVQRRLLEATLNRHDYKTITAEDGESAIHALSANHDIGAVVLDLVMPHVDGLAVLHKMAADELRMPVIVQTAQGSMETAIKAMRAGAFDFLVKPASPDKLISSVANALKVKQHASQPRSGSEASKTTAPKRTVIGASAEMQRVRTLVAKAADSDIPVLIEGQSGTGKELVAHAIQSQGRRAAKPFIIVNCGALPENLIESILFGHEKGAFTGATEKRAGKFSEAHGGTLFLDEVGDLPIEAQVKLLRAIQEGQIEPVGSSRSVSVNVRLISATNRDLVTLVREGRFREDLFYRLNVFPIIVPPLRNRIEDIPALAKHFMDRIARSEGKTLSLGDDAVALFSRYDWPGNIRQLENTMFRAVVLANEDETLSVEHFAQIAQQLQAPLSHRDTAFAAHRPPEQIIAAPAMVEPEPADQPDVHSADSIWHLDGNIRSLAEIEAVVIKAALQRYNRRMSDVARRLGIGRSTLYRKLKEYDIDA
ncbi:MAG: sigma-54 dependent transcriptional regulator [Pseudomonadota bacterium]